MTPTDFRAWLQQEVRRNYKNQQAAANAWGISKQYLCDILHGRREPGEAILREVGWRRVVSYERIAEKLQV